MQSNDSSMDFEKTLVEPSKSRTVIAASIQILGLIGIVLSVLNFFFHFMSNSLWIPSAFLFFLGMGLGMRVSKVTTISSPSGRDISFDEAAEAYNEEVDRQERLRRRD